MKHCIVLASGSGMRFDADVPKQFVRVDGRMIIEYTLAACDCGVFDDMILVVAASYVEVMKDVIQKGNFTVPIKVIEGGSSRLESCARGVEAIEDDDGLVVIHNGVQPLVTRRTFDRCLKALEAYPAVTSGLPCVYTVLETDEEGVLRRLAPRALCFGDLGPECFHLDIIRKALDLGKGEDGLTNLTGIMLKYALGDVKVVEGEFNNFKITYQEDIDRFKHIMKGALK